MAHQQCQAWCDDCQRETLFARDSAETNHVLHFLISCFTCGFWIFAWAWCAFCNYMANRRRAWHCQHCGRREIGS